MSEAICHCWLGDRKDVCPIKCCRDEFMARRGGTGLSPVKSTVILYCFHAVDEVPGRTFGLKNTATVIPTGLHFGK